MFQVPRILLSWPHKSLIPCETTITRHSTNVWFSRISNSKICTGDSNTVFFLLALNVAQLNDALFGLWLFCNGCVVRVQPWKKKKKKSRKIVSLNDKHIIDVSYKEDIFFDLLFFSNLKKPIKGCTSLFFPLLRFHVLSHIMKWLTAGACLVKYQHWRLKSVGVAWNIILDWPGFNCQWSAPPTQQRSSYKVCLHSEPEIMLLNKQTRWLCGDLAEYGKKNISGF